MGKRNFFVGKLFKQCTAFPYDLVLRVDAAPEGKTMTENVQRETAKIYQFPVKARAGKASQQSDPPSRLAPVEFGSGWYHDAAIQDADQARRR